MSRLLLDPALRGALLAETASPDVAQRVVDHIAAYDALAAAALTVRDGAAVAYAPSVSLWIAVLADSGERLKIAFARSRGDAEAAILRELGRKEAA